MELLNAVWLAVLLFASTNIDDIFVLIAFFSGPRFKASQIAIGQFAGITALFLVSLVGSMIALVLRQEYVGLLGLLPIAIGVKNLVELRLSSSSDDEALATEASMGNILGVAAVTIANGGDNIGIYTPVFATSTSAELIIFAIVFAVLVLAWLVFASWLVGHPAIGRPIKRYSHIVTPIVLIGIGLLVLYEAGSSSLVSRL